MEKSDPTAGVTPNGGGTRSATCSRRWSPRWSGNVDAVRAGGVVSTPGPFPTPAPTSTHVAVVPSGIGVIDTKAYRGVLVTGPLALARSLTVPGPSTPWHGRRWFAGWREPSLHAQCQGLAPSLVA